MEVSGPYRESFNTSKQVAILGFSAFILFFSVMLVRSTNVLIVSIVKSLPAQFLSWCITRDQVLRIRKNEFGNRLSGVDDEHRKKSGDFISSQLVRFQHYISTALVFCAIGDFCLDMERHPSWESNIWFLAGLVSFLVGHIFFILGMQKRIKDLTSSDQIKNENLWALPCVMIYVVTICYIILPHISDIVLQGGVIAYAAVIGIMVYNSLVMTVLDSKLNIFCRSELKKLKSEDR